MFASCARRVGAPRPTPCISQVLPQRLPGSVCGRRQRACVQCVGRQSVRYTTQSKRGRFLVAAQARENDYRVAEIKELSPTVNEDLLLFFFKLDLTAKLQRAMNMEQMEMAQLIRERLEELEEAAEVCTLHYAGSRYFCPVLEAEMAPEQFSTAEV